MGVTVVVALLVASGFFVCPITFTVFELAGAAAGMDAGLGLDA